MTELLKAMVEEAVQNRQAELSAVRRGESEKRVKKALHRRRYKPAALEKYKQSSSDYKLFRERNND